MMGTYIFMFLWCLIAKRERGCSDDDVRKCCGRRRLTHDMNHNTRTMEHCHRKVKGVRAVHESECSGVMQ
jgi:hypothetical protein